MTKIKIVKKKLKIGMRKIEVAKKNLNKVMRKIKIDWKKLNLDITKSRLPRTKKLKIVIKNKGFLEKVQQKYKKKSRLLRKN